MFKEKFGNPRRLSALLILKLEVMLRRQLSALLTLKLM